MSALTFNHAPTASPTSVRPAAAVALQQPFAQPAGRRAPSSKMIVIGAIAGLHVAGVVVLSNGRQRPVAPPVPASIMISFVAPKVVAPPAPPAARAEPPKERVRYSAPAPAPALPIVASELPVTPVAANTVQVAHTPVAAPPEPAPAPAPEPVTEARGYAGYLHNPAPDYPLAAQKRGLEGQVILKVHVLSSGQPDSVTVARSSGHQILDEAALKAVLQWAFAPARRGQTPIDGWVQVPLNFKI